MTIIPIITSIVNIITSINFLAALTLVWKDCK